MSLGFGIASMKAIGWAALFVSIVGIPLHVLATPGPVDEDMPTVTLCELGRDPDTYAGRFVRVRVDIRGRRELSAHEVGRHEPCASYIYVLLAFPNDVKPRPDFRVEEDASFQQLQKALQGATISEATVEARFDAVVTRRDGKLEWTGKGFGRKHLAEGRLVVRRVSDVVVRPLPGK